MALYTRRIDKPTGKVYITPVVADLIPTYGVPALGLAPNGTWVPMALQGDGSIIISPDGPSTPPHFDDVVTDVTPGVLQTLIDEIVPAGTTRELTQVFVNTRVTGIFIVSAGGAPIGSGRTGPGCVPLMTFNPPRPLLEGVEYKVEFTSRAGAPVQSVECFVQSSDLTA